MVIFISIATPARPIEPPRRKRERELFTFDILRSRFAFLACAILMTRFVFITTVIMDPIQVNVHNKGNNK